MLLSFLFAAFSSRKFELINITKQERIEIGNQITFNTFMVARLKAVFEKFQLVKYATGYMLMTHK